MDNSLSEICRKLFFKTGQIGYYNLANELEREYNKEQIAEEEKDL